MSLLRFSPNVVTTFRLLLGIPIAYHLWKGQASTALWLLVVAGLSDLFDGFLAREYDWRTVLGSWLDPAVDKILITTILVVLTIRGDVPYWFFGITLFRDVGLTAGTLSLVLSGIKVKISPLLSGKIATGGQNVALLLAIFSQIWDVPSGVLLFVFLGSAILTLVSCVHYSNSLYRIIRNRPKPSSTA